MNESKIQFSTAETDLMNNSEIILTKNIVLQKIQKLLAQIVTKEMEYVKQQSINHLPNFIVPPKISKGENYGGLPYLILDYPRVFEKENIMAIRHMFWWGNAFSITLHLSGRYKKELLPHIIDAYGYFSDGGYFINASDDQWMHAIEQPNYIAVKAVNAEEFEKACKKFNHLKLATSWPLTDVNVLTEPLVAGWKRLIEIVV
jgi:hypothetical protein